MTAILVVCTGNICRSPTAAALLRQALDRRFGPLATKVRSAGTLGWSGRFPPPEAVATAAELGADLSSHRAVALDETMIEEADVAVGMAEEHREAILDVVPHAASRTFTLKELVRLLEALPPVGDGGPEGLADRIRAAEALRASGLPREPVDEDVPDPLGGTLGDFRAVAAEINALVDRLVVAVWGAPAGDRPTLGTSAGAERA